jgi:hypothetical protein
VDPPGIRPAGGAQFVTATVAGLGSIFTSAMLHNVSHDSPLGASAPRIVTMVRQGQAGQLIARLPGRRAEVAASIKAAFAAA